MDYALEPIKTYELNTLEAIKEAVINEKRLTPTEEISEKFLASLKGVSDKTRESYRKGVKNFFKYCELHNIERVEEEDITNYYNSLVERIGKEHNGLTINSVNLFIVSLRKLYKFLEKKGIKNLASDLKSVKTTRQPKKDPLTKEQALELLRSIDTTTEVGKRDYAIITLLLHAGLRTIELERANVEDLRTLGSKQVLQVQGKGHKEKDDYVKLTLAPYNAIMDYLSIRKNVKSTDALFTSLSDRSNGQRLKTRSIREIVKNRLKAININTDRITTHSLRHSAITFALLGGATIQEAQAIARHERIDTTLIYAHNLDKLKSNYEESIDNYLAS